MSAPDLTPEQKQRIKDLAAAQIKRGAEDAAKQAGLSLWQRIKRWFKR